MNIYNNVRPKAQRHPRAELRDLRVHLLRGVSNILYTHNYTELDIRILYTYYYT